VSSYPSFGGEVVTRSFKHSLMPVAQHTVLRQELRGEAPPQPSYMPLLLPELWNPALSHPTCPGRQPGLSLKPDYLQIPPALMASNVHCPASIVCFISWWQQEQKFSTD